VTDLILQDVVSLVIQGVGGGIAASAVTLAGSNNVRDISLTPNLSFAANTLLHDRVPTLCWEELLSN
jgi:hypothetical protein